MVRSRCRLSRRRSRRRSTGHSCGALPRAQRVVEWKHLVADDLAGLMALARDEDDVSLTRNANGLGDGFAPPGDLACSGRSGHDRGPYECGILAPGIVVRDDNDVG